MKATNREAWLKAGVAALVKLMERAGVTAPAVEPYVSVGFPKGGRGRSKAIGQCWDGRASADSRPHIFVCPTQEHGPHILAILLHELIHAAVGCQHGHRGPFASAARACGLTGKMTATVAGDALLVDLKDIAAKLGDYPHAPLSEGATKKKGSRLRLWECECGVKVRVASDEFDATCGLCNERFEQM